MLADFDRIGADTCVDVIVEWDLWDLVVVLWKSALLDVRFDVLDCRLVVVVLNLLHLDFQVAIQIARPLKFLALCYSH